MAFVIIILEENSITLFVVTFSKISLLILNFKEKKSFSKFIRTYLLHLSI